MTRALSWCKPRRRGTCLGPGKAEKPFRFFIKWGGSQQEDQMVESEYWTVASSRATNSSGRENSLHYIRGRGLAIVSPWFGQANTAARAAALRQQSSEGQKLQCNGTVSRSWRVEKKDRFKMASLCEPARLWRVHAPLWAGYSAAPAFWSFPWLPSPSCCRPSLCFIYLFVTSRGILRAKPKLKPRYVRIFAHSSFIPNIFFHNIIYCAGFYLKSLQFGIRLNRNSYSARPNEEMQPFFVDFVKHRHVRQVSSILHLIFAIKSNSCFFKD